MNGAGVVAGWIGLVRRRWRWGVGVGVVVLAVAVALVFTARPIYRAEARLRLGEAPPAPGVSPTSSILGMFRMGGDPFANDLELLESRTLGEDVTKLVALNVALTTPRGWHRDSLFTAIHGAGATVRAAERFSLTWKPDGSIVVQRTAPRDSAVGTFGPGETVRFAGVELVPSARRPGAPDEIGVSVSPIAAVASSTAGLIQVERIRREANVVRIRVEHPDPRVAEEAVRATVASFMGLRASIMARESGETVDSLRAVADRTRAELIAAEEALRDQQQSSGLIAPDAQNAAVVERLVEVETELEMARQDLDAVNTMLARAEAAPDAATAWTVLVAHPRFIANETMGTLLSRLVMLEEQRTALAGRRSEENLEYRTIVEQMRYLDGALRAVAASYRDALGERIGALEKINGEMRAGLATVPGRALELARSQRQARMLSEIVIATEQRLRTEELRQAMTFSNVQVIDAPMLAYRPVWPRKKMGLAVGMLLAFGFAVLAMVVVESADATVRSARQLSSMAGAPVLAALTVNGRISPPPAPEAAAMLTIGNSVGVRPRPLVVVTVDGNGSQLAADQVQAVLAAAGWEGDPREVVVSAPVTSYAAARQALVPGGPVLLAVIQGRTGLPAVERAVRLLREAGGGVAGVVVVCRSDEEAGELWS